MVVSVEAALAGGAALGAPGLLAVTAAAKFYSVPVRNPGSTGYGAVEPGLTWQRKSTNTLKRNIFLLPMLMARFLISLVDRCVFK